MVCKKVDFGEKTIAEGQIWKNILLAEENSLSPHSRKIMVRPLEDYLSILKIAAHPYASAITGLDMKSSIHVQDKTILPQAQPFIYKLWYHTYLSKSLMHLHCDHSHEHPMDGTRDNA